MGEGDWTVGGEVEGTGEEVGCEGHAWGTVLGVRFEGLSWFTTVFAIHCFSFIILCFLLCMNLT